MGCKNSKQADQATGFADINKPAEQSGVGPIPDIKNKPPPSPAFQSDVQEKQKGVKSFSEVLVQRNQNSLHEVYDVDDAHVLGRGACGSVCVVKKKSTGEFFAMKTVAVESLGGASLGSTLEELRREIEIQKALDHPNIARVFEYFEDPVANQVHIVMELCRGGALVSRMKTHRNGYGERAAATLVEKMLSAVLYCHNRGVVHRDIKLDNFIYEDEAEDAELKLIDFGFACEVAPGNESMWDQIGTPSYMAPELWADHSKAYDSSVDMWAIGVVTFMLLSGKRPFHHADRKEKKRMIMQDPVRFVGAEWDRVSQHGKDFCLALMQKDPRKRLGASQALAHPWIKNASMLHDGLDIAEEVERQNHIVESLQSFAKADNMKKVALEVIAFSTPPSKVDELRTLFRRIDSNDSGTISQDEFRAAMAGQMTEEDADNLFRLIDINGSKEIEYTEFLGAALESRKNNAIQKPSLMSAFSILDRDGDGVITTSELGHLLGDDYTEEELIQMVEQAGGSDGQLNYEQFKAMMLKDMTTGIQGTRGWKSTGKLTTLAAHRLSNASHSDS